MTHDAFIKSVFEFLEVGKGKELSPSPARRVPSGRWLVVSDGGARVCRNDRALVPSACTAETVSGPISHLGSVISLGDTVAGWLPSLWLPGARECGTHRGGCPAGWQAFAVLSKPVGRQFSTLPGPGWPWGACPSDH